MPSSYHAVPKLISLLLKTLACEEGMYKLNLQVVTARSEGVEQVLSAAS